MSAYSMQAPKRRWPKLLLILVLIIGLLLGGAAVGAYRFYQENLKPVSASQKQIVVTIPLGASLSEISDLLADAGVIRSDWAFERYVRNAGLENELQAGTYSLLPSQSVQEIVVIITRGEIMKDLVTILPGQRIDQIRQALINHGFDEPEVDAALDPSNYEDHPALVEKPEGVGLEGYLYPESFQMTAETTAESIIRSSLDEMQNRLTPDVRNGIVAQGLTVYQGIILASILEQEVIDPEEKRQASQVFLSRLQIGMKLESDATAPYGAILAGEEPSLTYDSRYNTYLHEGLPPTPISNISEASLQAVANPAGTDWLYFVSGDDGVTHFSKTLEEHEALTRQYCTKLCGN